MILFKGLSARNFIFILITLIAKLTLNAQDILVTTKTITLGLDTVQLIIHEKKGEQIVYIHVHENETASLEAGLDVLNKYGGKLVTLKHTFDGTTNRFVTFRYNNSTYQFDPNRIYTTNDSLLQSKISVVDGIGKVNEKVKKIVKNLASEIWEEVSFYPLIVALHNNKNTSPEIRNIWFFWEKYEPESYNITSYIKKGDYSSDTNKSASDIYINTEINNSEFFIVTERQDFISFYNKRFSVVLQSENPVDDGSMSVFAAGNQKRYINAEAKHGKVEEQKAMLELLHQH
ncbi:MAG: hypothetical protein H7X99_08295 [Saprospiraceae bacterium]|nr:hypothetical protein [Saprospiraceae bacterium]